MKFKKLLALCLTAAMFLTAGSGAFAATASGSDDKAPADKKFSASKSTAEPRTYNEGETSGTCGDSMTWSYNTSTCVLTISGSGAMTWANWDDCPWGEYKSKISRIVFSGKITSIRKEAFMDCTNLETVSIPDSVKEIGRSAFHGCRNLEKVIFGVNSNLTTFGEFDYNDGVFQNCINLYEILLPSKLTSIPRETFAGCTNLETVNIGKSITYIGDNAFESCNNLEKIVIPSNVESIGNEVFSNCKRLSSVKLENGLKTIGNDVFINCNSLKSISIPASVTEMGYGVFRNLNNLTSISFASNSNLLSIESRSSFSGYGIFQNCTRLKSITLPEKLAEIPYEAFAGCTNLETVKIGNGVICIDSYAFEDCVSIKSIIVPNSVIEIGYKSFCGCTNLSSIKFGSSLETIGNLAFINCNSLKSLIIPASVTKIGYSAFKNLGNITSVTFEADSNLTSLGTNDYYNEGVFQNCTGIKSIVLPDKLTSINLYSFCGCSNLESVIIGKHVTSISRAAFGNCSSLKEIVIPKTLTSISWDAFSNCSSLNTVKYTGSESRWNSLKEDGIDSDGNSAFLSAPKYIYNYTGAPIVITTQPTSKTVVLGNPVTVSLKATADYLYYQWYYKKAGQTSFTEWSGRTHASETVTPNASWNGIQLYCVLTDPFGKTAQSNAITIKVSSGLEITSHPANVTVHTGDNATFKVTATGTGLKYQWYYKKDGATSWSAWNGRTAASTTATANDTWNKMQVRCKVTDSSNTSLYSNAATITIAAELKITSHPSNVTVASGSNATFKVVATGTGLKYQWQYKKSGATSWSNWGSRTTASTTATANDSWNKMQVRCRVTDAAGKYVYSNAATVTIGSSALSITKHPANVTVHSGDNATFKVTATGTGLKYQWQYKKSGATSWSTWNGRTTASTTATANDSWNKMQVRCKVTDSTGKTVYSNAATITIAAPLKITQQPSNITTSAGNDVAFIIKATGTGLKYQWYYKKIGATTWNVWNGRTTSSTIATANSTWNGMQVRCIVTDAAGTKITSNTIKITLQ